MARSPWEHCNSQKNNIKHSILNTVNDWNLWNHSTALTEIVVYSNEILHFICFTLFVLK